MGGSQGGQRSSLSIIWQVRSDDVAFEKKIDPHGDDPGCNGSASVRLR